jgi:putative ABC transport system permease protein
VYIKAPRWQKPIEEAIDPGKAHLGFALAQELDLQPGGTLTFQGQTFTVEHILPQAGNEDDIALRVGLETAQELLDRKDKVSAVLALMCNCADGDPEIVRREVDKFISGIQVVDFTVRAQARQTARNAIEEGTRAELDDIVESRAALRSQVATFAGVLTGLVSIGTILLLGVLTFNNARERRGEVAMLRALGLSARRILTLFLGKALVIGFAGGIAGCLIGLAGTRAVAGPGAVVPASFAVVVVAVSIGIAVLTSLIPASNAAAQDPAGILNRE